LGSLNRLRNSDNTLIDYSSRVVPRLSSDGTLFNWYFGIEICVTWLTDKSEYSFLMQLALRVLLPFMTSYLCESTFSTLICFK
jgi:hypothetical protein